MMQIVMFVVLGLLVFPSRLVNVAAPALALGFFLIFVARPAIAFLLLTGSRLDAREKLLVGWGGLRGAVPIILAIYPLTQGAANSHTIFNIVFFVVLLSVLFQGSSIKWLAERFGLYVAEPAPPPLHVELASWHVVDGDVRLLRVTENSLAKGVALRDLALPHDVLAMLIVRGEELVTPRGSTILKADDYVYFFVREKDRVALDRLFQA
jgi:cell volume regulation protein A